MLHYLKQLTLCSRMIRTRRGRWCSQTPIPFITVPLIQSRVNTRSEMGYLTNKFIVISSFSVRGPDQHLLGVRSQRDNDISNGETELAGV